MEECVYLITGGFTMFCMQSSGADWDYPMQQEMVAWLSEGAEHWFYNDGDGPLTMICIKVRVDRAQQQPGKEVRRRIARLTDVVPEVEKGRDLKIIFRGSALGSERIDTVENAIFHSGGLTPIHSVSQMEEVFYILRGRGEATVGDKRISIKAGDAIAIPAGTPHNVEAAPNELLQYAICNIWIYS
jgi:quercetin dioxygenase-like cupin family protein